ncbi:MAG: hypothetical protein ACTS73_08545 [Arsenophonus sp. NEOnobi-MAG3]
MPLLIKPLIFCWQGFQRTISCSDEEAGERLRITFGILRISVREHLRQ